MNNDSKYLHVILGTEVRASDLIGTYESGYEYIVLDYFDMMNVGDQFCTFNPVIARCDPDEDWADTISFTQLKNGEVVPLMNAYSEITADDVKAYKKQPQIFLFERPLKLKMRGTPYGIAYGIIGVLIT